MKKLLALLTVFTLAIFAQSAKAHTVVCMSSSLGLGGADMSLTCYRHINITTSDDKHCYIKLDPSSYVYGIRGATASFKTPVTSQSKGTGLVVETSGKVSAGFGNELYANISNASLYNTLNTGASMTAAALGTALGTSAQIVTGGASNSAAAAVQAAIAILGASLCQ